jgi:hypothetical protein
MQGLLRVREVSDLFVDVCVREPDTGDLLFLSIFGRDGAMLNFFASFSLPPSQGGLTEFHLVDAEDIQHVVHVGKADSLAKHTGKLPAKGSLFGNLTHAWLYEPRIQGVDRPNRSTWALFPLATYACAEVQTQQGVADAVWRQVQDLSPLPLPDEWRSTVMDLCDGYVSWLDEPGVLYPPLGPIMACRIALPDAFMTRLSDAVRSGALRLPGEASLPSKLAPLEPLAALGRTSVAEEDELATAAVVKVVNLTGKSLFQLGRMVTTRAVHETIPPMFVLDCIRRHQSGDWGDMSSGDKHQNDAAVKSGEDRIFSSYPIPEGIASADCHEEKVWVITEWDRSVTTVLFPSDY